ncbi:hypothetical protein Pcinc_010395 [Petrolisthes cinctipes]|uniref:Uncharacterized protein n=1 Tax=Petrolisthes cinctipes TaxID=88211 RepID=A0AAE1KVG8_PETCI|nr:hypothetical protein Pcinc_010395 [Petrolisthes cinctipes]
MEVERRRNSVGVGGGKGTVMEVERRRNSGGGGGGKGTVMEVERQRNSGGGGEGKGRVMEVERRRDSGGCGGGIGRDRHGGERRKKFLAKNEQEDNVIGSFKDPSLIVDDRTLPLCPVMVTKAYLDVTQDFCKENLFYNSRSHKPLGPRIVARLLCCIIEAA